MPFSAAIDVFRVFLRLGLTSFGGPVAHLGYFRTTFVQRLKWLDDKAYAELVALCQFLPGPASSQVGFAIGLKRAGLLGGLAAWVAFTLPSALALLALALWLGETDGLPMGVLSGLKIAAFAVVADAVWSMSKNLTPDHSRRALALLAAILALLLPHQFTQMGIIALSALVGTFSFKSTAAPDRAQAPRNSGAALFYLLAFLILLIGLPLITSFTDNQTLSVIDQFYRAGALVFGGGHVVLPLLETSFVATGQIDTEVFLAGYGAAQAVPGPLFAFAAFLGSSLKQSPNGWFGAGLGLIAIYLPSLLLVLGVLPFWDKLRARPGAGGAIAGANAGVVGILLAALYTPIFTSAIASSAHLALAIAAFGALKLIHLPPWLVVAGTAILGGLFLS